MGSQDRTLDRYQELMQINAAGHVIRAAREVGLLDELRAGQRTIEQLRESLGLDGEAIGLMLDCLISMNVVERYGDDHALSPVMQLLCQHDGDLGDSLWAGLSRRLTGGQRETRDEAYLDAIAATQWIHTPAAMQVAEMLDVGGEPDDVASADDLGIPNGSRSQRRPLRILDLGCGSAVWSCALAYRDPRATVLAVDQEPSLVAARRTADSIGLGDRFQTLAGVPESTELPVAGFDLVVIAQRLGVVPAESGDRLLRVAHESLAPGGRLVIIDLFRGPTKPRLAETIEALRLHVATSGGRMRTLAEAEASVVRLGFSKPQFTFIAASRVNLGLLLAHRSEA